MKRNMDLIRKICFSQKNTAATPKRTPRIKIDGHDLYDISFPITLLKEAKLVFAEADSTVENTGRPRYAIYRKDYVEGLRLP